jgi:hypothetical protein
MSFHSAFGRYGALPSYLRVAPMASFFLLLRRHSGAEIRTLRRRGFCRNYVIYRQGIGKVLVPRAKASSRRRKLAVLAY